VIEDLRTAALTWTEDELAALAAEELAGQAGTILPE